MCAGTLILEIPTVECNLLHTLMTGQSFQWTQTEANEWIGVVAQCVFLAKQTQTHAEVYLLNEEKDALRIAKNYFSCDAPDHDQSQVCSGVRVLQQDPFECLISFLCCANNKNTVVTRIQRFVRTERLREHYGNCLGVFAGQNFYQFPSMEQLSACSKEQLQSLGFTVRSADHIVKVVDQLRHKSNDFLNSLHRSKTQKTSAAIIQCLQQFHGVGQKVAEHVALYSLQCWSGKKHKQNSTETCSAVANKKQCL